MQHYEKKKILTVACCNYSNLYVNMTFVCNELQIAALKTAKRRNPNGRWWIKTDACDMRAGVMEFMWHEWSMDVDLGDGQLPAPHHQYMALLDFVKRIGLNRRKPSTEIVKDLTQLMTTLQNDAEFLEDGLCKSTDTYEKKR